MWDFGEEKDKGVLNFPFNRGDNKPCRCKQHLWPVSFCMTFAQNWAISTYALICCQIGQFFGQIHPKIAIFQVLLATAWFVITTIWVLLSVLHYKVPRSLLKNTIWGKPVAPHTGTNSKCMVSTNPETEKKTVRNLEIFEKLSWYLLSYKRSVGII